MTLARSLACAIALFGVAAASAVAQQPVQYNFGQTISGQADYDRHCSSCHGLDLGGSGPSVALKGAAFMKKWGGKTADALFADISRMPPGQADKLMPGQRAAIAAVILQANAIPIGERPFPAAPEALARMIIPASDSQQPRNATPPLVIAAPAGPSRLDKLTPADRKTLEAPPANDWLHWRGGQNAAGFSALKQINKSNVGGLKTAWSWALPRGDNMMTPIIHDGVLYAYSHGDIVEALDGATGDLLWRFERRLTGPAGFQGKKGVAIAGDRVLVPTSDMHVVALNAKTGAVIWDHAIDVGGASDFQIKSAPLVAGDKVVIGVNGFTTRGGNFIAAFDLETGKEVWRVHTIARPEEAGGDSWNGLPLQARTGGSVWVAASYDPGLNLIYFGSGPTYNTEVLRAAKPGINRDALYTNATLAVNADTGKIAWYFQHQQNDQLDHDWAFERTLIELPINGVKRKIVLTAGKAALFDALDAATGKYLFSIDLGMQNVIASVDPMTGAKIINPAAIPSPGQAMARGGMPGICPDLLGARNLMSTSYDPGRALLFVPLTDTCIQPWPTGKRWQKTPDPATDGQFGILKAIEPATRKTRWTIRERAAPVSGSLATAGDLVFVGDADRWLRAYDSTTGKMLWSTRLDNVPVSYPSTYSIGGKQYVAVATNEGFVHVQAMQQALRTRPQPNEGATLWVFALPDK